VSAWVKKCMDLVVESVRPRGIDQKEHGMKWLRVI